MHPRSLPFSISRQMHISHRCGTTLNLSRLRHNTQSQLPQHLQNPPTIFGACASYSTTTEVSSSSSSIPATPPLLLKIRFDMKGAMRAKDQERLNAIKNILSSISNAQKSPTPPTTDTHILSLIKKQLSLLQNSISYFKSANRDDLVEKEQAQVDVLQAYVDSVDIISNEEVQRIVQDILVQMEGTPGAKIQMGSVMKEVVKVLEAEGKAFVKAEVAGLVKELMGGK